MWLREFLDARIREDEATAHAAIKERNHDVRPWREDGGSISDADGQGLAGYMGEDVAPHVVRWYPPRVVSECYAKRLFLAAVDAVPMWPDEATAIAVERAICALALPYADHPDYDPEWAVS